MVQVPNFTPGAGRLATDRFDFQDHVDGYKFQHKANAIVLSPAISVNGGSASSNLQTVITQINALVPQVIPDASNSTKGLIQLAGDLTPGISGAASPKVVGIQGRPISNAAPNNGDVLTWNGGTLAWEPEAISTSPTFNSLLVTGNSTFDGFSALEGGYDLNGTGNFFISATGNITINPSGSLTVQPHSYAITATNSSSIGSSNVLTLSGQNITLNGGFGGVTLNGAEVDVITNLVVGVSSGNVMSVNSTTTFQNNVTIGSGGSNSLLIKSLIGNSGQSTVVGGLLAFSGSSARITLRGVVLANTNQTVIVTNIKYLVAPSSLSGTHSYTITDTGVAEGDWFQFYNGSLYLQNLIGAVSEAVAAGGVRQFVRIGGVWVLVSKPT